MLTTSSFYLCWPKEIRYSLSLLDRPLPHWWGLLESLRVCQPSRTSIWEESEADNPEKNSLCSDLAFKGNEDQKVIAQCPSPEVFCRIHSITKLAPVPWDSSHHSSSLYHHNMYICGWDSLPHKDKSEGKKMTARIPSQPPHPAASSLPKSTIAKGFPWEIAHQKGRRHLRYFLIHLLKANPSVGTS